jgi:hypothetical protein
MSLPGTLSLDEPKSGIHLDVEGACLARPLDAGTAGAATCPELAAGAVASDVMAVVAGDGGSPRYVVQIVTEAPRLGTGEERARRVAAELGDAVVEPPTAVSFGEQHFLRVRLGPKKGPGVCFVTADDRSEVATVVFLAIDDGGDADAAVEKKADVAMATLQRSAPEAIRHDGSPSRGSDALVIAFLVIVAGAFGLFVVLKFVFIARLFGFKLGGASERRTEDPRGPRDPAKDGPQVAGMKCVACKKNIVSDREGMHCPDCDRPIHKECHGKHVTAAHVATPGAYR